MFKDMIDKTRNGVDRISHLGTHAAGAPKRAAVNFKDASHHKVVQVAEEFHECLPAFEKAGFTLQNLEIEIGISPKIIPHFMITRHVSEEEQKAAIAELKHNRLLKTVMEALLKAGYLHKHVRVGDLPFTGIEVHLAVVPTVRLLFGKDQSARKAKRQVLPPAEAG